MLFELLSQTLGKGLKPTSFKYSNALESNSAVAKMLRGSGIYKSFVWDLWNNSSSIFCMFWGPQWFQIVVKVHFWMCFYMVLFWVFLFRMPWWESESVKFGIPEQCIISSCWSRLHPGSVPGYISMKMIPNLVRYASFSDDVLKLAKQPPCRLFTADTVGSFTLQLTIDDKKELTMSPFVGGL